MGSILEQIAKTYNSAFRPSNADEHFALRLAWHLVEPQAAAHHAVLLGRYSRSHLIAAYHKTKASFRKGENLGAIFHYELQNTAPPTNEHHQVRLLTLRIERRSVDAAFFSGTELRGLRFRSLPSRTEAAESAAAGFVAALLSDFQPECAAMEALHRPYGAHRAQIYQVVREQLKNAGLPISVVDLASVLTSFSHPPLRSRRELREVLASMYKAILLRRRQVTGWDAVALGLHVQTERFFTSNEFAI